MSFMTKEITDKKDWYEIDTELGTEYIPVELVGVANLDNETEKTELYKRLRKHIHGKKIISVVVKNGYGARLSAKLDHTEWSVHDTVEEATVVLDDRFDLLVEDDYYGADE
jgi:hypothetical protein